MNERSPLHPKRFIAPLAATTALLAGSVAPGNQEPAPYPEVPDITDEPSDGDPGDNKTEVQGPLQGPQEPVVEGEFWVNQPYAPNFDEGPEARQVKNKKQIDDIGNFVVRLVEDKHGRVRAIVEGVASDEDRVTGPVDATLGGPSKENQNLADARGQFVGGELENELDANGGDAGNVSVEIREGIDHALSPSAQKTISFMAENLGYPNVSSLITAYRQGELSPGDAKVMSGYLDANEGARVTVVSGGLPGLGMPPSGDEKSPDGIGKVPKKPDPDPLRPPFLPRVTRREGDNEDDDGQAPIPPAVLPGDPELPYKPPRDAAFKNRSDNIPGAPSSVRSVARHTKQPRGFNANPRKGLNQRGQSQNRGRGGNRAGSRG